MRFICRCCGAGYEKAPRLNPNLCSGCEQLLEDDSPEAILSFEEQDKKAAQKPKNEASKPASKRASVTNPSR
jgi:hypothetical protein